MTMFINGRFLTQPTTGVQRFAREITRHLCQIMPDSCVIVPKNTNIPEDLDCNFVTVGQHSGTLWEQLELSQYMKRAGGFLLNLCNTAPIGYDRNLVTIHDLGVFENSAWYSWKFSSWYKFITPRIVKGAKALITVSETSKQELVEKFGVSADSVIVAYDGLAKEFSQVVASTKEPIILHVGTFSERKNVKFLVDCFLRSADRGYKLVLCGSFDNNLTNSSDYANSDRLKLIENPTDIELRALYRKSAYVVSASLYEGFGLPVLEGIAHGARPLLSNIPVYRELFADGTTFFHPEKKDELVAVFNDLPIKTTALEQPIIGSYIDRYDFNRSAQIISKSIQGL